MLHYCQIDIVDAWEPKQWRKVCLCMEISDRLCLKVESQQFKLPRILCISTLYPQSVGDQFGFGLFR